MVFNNKGLTRIYSSITLSRPYWNPIYGLGIRNYVRADASLVGWPFTLSNYTAYIQQFGTIPKIRGPTFRKSSPMRSYENLNSVLNHYPLFLSKECTGHWDTDGRNQ